MVRYSNLTVIGVASLLLLSCEDSEDTVPSARPAEQTKMLGESVDPQSMLSALRVPASEDHQLALQMLRSDTEARRGIVRLAEHPNASRRDATDAVAWLTRHPEPSLRSFYHDRLVALSETRTRDDAVTTQALDLSAALGIVGSEEDMTALAVGVDWLVRADVNGRSRVKLTDWSFWRLVVATVALADNAKSRANQNIDRVRKFVNNDIGQLNADRSDAINYQQAGLLFATEYARQLENGRSTTEALIQIYGSAEDYLVRVAAMNSLRVIGKIETADTRLYAIFPFRSQWEVDQYLDNVFTWSLQNIGAGGGGDELFPIEVLLADGRLATERLSGRALDEEVEAKRAALTAARDQWPTSSAGAIEPAQSLTPLLATPALGAVELFRDRRLERPILGGVR